MEYINIYPIIILFIFFIIYINYSQRYSTFIINENNLEKIENKIYYIKKEYEYKINLLKTQKKMIKMDDIILYKLIDGLNKRYTLILKLLNIEIEQIKNLNKVYLKKIKKIDNINILPILKKDYKNKMKKIQDTGYIMIYKLEKYNSKLINNLYKFYKLEIKNQNIIDIQKRYEDDIININKDYLIKLNNFKNLKRGILKKNKNKCNTHIYWEDTKPNIKCCEFNSPKK